MRQKLGGRTLKRAVSLAAGGLLVVLAVTAVAMHPWSAGSSSGESGAGAGVGGSFTLTAPDGHSVTEGDFRGKWMLVYFGYTHCPDACPLALNNVANALDLMQAKRDDVAPLFISVDPLRDTPAVMGRYVGLFDKQIVGLTGTQPQIVKVEREYHVYAARHPAKNGGYTMDHSSILYVMDKTGRFDTVIDAGASPKEIAAALEKLDS